ncbi:cysteine--tRNA ligase [Aeromicrobium sp.]|nr:cysteine--tRNA ligase [Candidatus Saccharibacteria bacterium]
MKLYNTLTRATETLAPLTAQQVTMYTCGPTVYDYAHIGHWYTYVRWDMLVRTLKISGFTPNWVMNITDVGHLVSDADDGEDKLEKGARREGKSAWEVAEFYTSDFLEGMHLLNITAPDMLTKATEHIAEQIAMIKVLEAKGYTYIIDDGVYYDTTKFEGYANFARLDLDDLQAGARVEFNTQKRNVSDFALWKFSPIDSEQQRDMQWDSPWSPPGTSAGSRKGFPGWHIECSAMAMKYLGETIDIHAGGIDHIQIHHTNEIAQSEAVTGKRFANIWLHSNHVMVEGEKISKSLGNGVRIQDLLERGIPAGAIRLHILESNYRSQSKFSTDGLVAATQRLSGYRAMAARGWQCVTDGGLSPKELLNYQQDMLHALQDDLNTPKVLFELSALETAIDIDGINIECQKAFFAFISWLKQALGIELLVNDIPEELRAMIIERERARSNKDWAKSDRLRDELSGQGITVKDTASGTIWHWQ